MLAGLNSLSHTAAHVHASTSTPHMQVITFPPLANQRNIWLWFDWDFFCPLKLSQHRLCRQLTAKRDSSAIWTALKTCMNLVVVQYNYILMQIAIVRHS